MLLRTLRIVTPLSVQSSSMRQVLLISCMEFLVLLETSRVEGSVLLLKIKKALYTFSTEDVKKE